VAAVAGLVQQFEEQVHLGRGILGFQVGQLEQVEMAAHLAQAQQGLEDLHARLLEALLGHQIEQLALRGFQQLLVDRLLVRAERALGHAFSILGGQVLGHVALQAAQQEGLSLRRRRACGLRRRPPAEMGSS
jgi:hypothetical protein